MNPVNSPDDVLESAEAADVRFVRLQFTDLNGMLKSVEIPAHQLRVALEHGVMFDGSSVEGFVRIEESDMYLAPDPATWHVLPWTTGDRRVARLICDVCLPDGRPFAGDPRTILRMAQKRAAQQGFSDFRVGLEAEFFLLALDASRRASVRPSDRSGYFDLVTTDVGERCRQDIVMTLQHMGFAVGTAHHEVSPGQHEIDLLPLSALAAADQYMTFKLVVKTIARRHGLHATFMPKPLYGTDGSGLHCRQSLVQDGRSVFSDAADPLGLSPQARHYVAGLLAHARALTAITNPVVNSYKRLVPGYEAPAYITWAANHPSPLVRTTVLADDAWIELRSPDPACNPYLAFAGMLAAGLDGMTSEQVPPPPANVDVHALSDEERLSRGIYRLPANLEQALEALEEDFILQEALGDHAISRLVRTRMLEWDAYRRTVHAWEHEQYLDL